MTCYSPHIHNICSNKNHIIFPIIRQFDIQIQPPPKSRHAAHDRFWDSAKKRPQNNETVTCVCWYLRRTCTHTCAYRSAAQRTHTHAHARTHPMFSIIIVSAAVPAVFYWYLLPSQMTRRTAAMFAYAHPTRATSNFSNR